MDKRKLKEDYPEAYKKWFQDDTQNLKDSINRADTLESKDRIKLSRTIQNPKDKNMNSSKSAREARPKSWFGKQIDKIQKEVMDSSEGGDDEDENENEKKMRSRSDHHQSYKERREKILITKEKIQKRYEKYYNKWRDYDLLTCILAMLGLVVGIIDYEYFLYLQSLNHDVDVQDSFVRVIITITTLLAIVSITFRHYSKTEWLNYPLPKDVQQEIYSYKVFDNNRNRQRKRSFLTLYFFLEIALIAVHPIPYFDFKFTITQLNFADRSKYISVTYRFSDFLLAFMFLRIILLIRSVFNYSMFTDLYAKRLCESYGFTANVRFTFKCFIIKNPGQTVLWTLAGSTIIFAYILRIFEIQYYRTINQVDFDNYFQSIWVIVITMTTVGFGDLVPYSYIGRSIVMLISFWGAFLITLLIVTVGKVFELTRNQRKAMHHLLLTRKAAASITSAMRYFLAKKRFKQFQQRLTGDRATGVDGGYNLNYMSSASAPESISILRRAHGGHWNYELEEELMLSERIEEQDLREYKIIMGNRLQEFRDEWQELKHLSIQNENEQELTMNLIKNEVIDLADKFDEMQQILYKQNEMITLLLKKHQEPPQHTEVIQRKPTEISNDSRNQSIDNDKSRSFKLAVEEVKEVPQPQRKYPEITVVPEEKKSPKESQRPISVNVMPIDRSKTLTDFSLKPPKNYYPGEHSANFASSQLQQMSALQEGLDPDDEAMKLSIRRSPFYQRNRSKYHRAKQSFLTPVRHGSMTMSADEADPNLDEKVTEKSKKSKQGSKKKEE